MTVETTFTDPALPTEATPRLGGQNAKILARLRLGSATNIELEECSGSRRVNSRVADVRRWLQSHEQKTVSCVAIDTAKGVHQYNITEFVPGDKNEKRNTSTLGRSESIAAIKSARQTILEFAEEEDLDDNEIEAVELSFDVILESLDFAEFVIWDALGCKPERNEFEQALYVALGLMRISRLT